MQSHIPSIALPAHAPADLRAWLIHIDLDASLDAAAAGVLDDAELARARRYMRHVDAVRFATVRAALRFVLAAHMDAEASALVIETDAHGRPVLVLDDAPDFNVSHSGAFGAIALSMQRRVGIDIEEARTSLDWRRLAPVVLAPADERVIDPLDMAAQRAAFFDCWTAKEAVLKAHGTGMGIGAIRMEAFSVLPRDGARFALSAQAGAFAAASLHAPEGYAASLAWSL
jgi:4'-phosphopantetheinyl transferase